MKLNSRKQKDNVSNRFLIQSNEFKDDFQHHRIQQSQRNTLSHIEQNTVQYNILQ